MDPRRPANLCVPFGALGVLLAHLTMSVVGLNDPARDAYVLCLALCLLAGGGLGWALPRLTLLGYPRMVTTLVLGAGMTVGGAVQSAAYAAEAPISLPPPLHTGNVGDWVLAGMITGAVPALLLVLLYRAATKQTAPSGDAAERVAAPMAAVTTLLAALSAAWMPHGASSAGRVISLGIALLGLGAMFGVARKDRARAAWLRRIHDGAHPDFELVTGAPTEGVPHAVANARGEALIVQLASAHDYRSAARTVVASTAADAGSAVAPLRRRGRALRATQLVSVAVLAFAVIGIDRASRRAQPNDAACCSL